MRRAITIAGVAAALALPGCTPGESAEVGDPGPAEVRVRTYDFAFDMPDTIAGGVTTIRLVNDGPDFHHVWLVRLEEGSSEEAILADLAAHRPLPAHAVAVGGPNTPGMPGEATVATLDLQPGDYLVVCVIPGMHDGELHVAKGMVKRLTVVPPSRSASLPQADIVMTLDDYRFDLSEAIGRGRQLIRVVNAARQAHEVVVVRLEPGRSAHDFLAFLQAPEGEPPGRLMGGTTWLDHGESNIIELDFDAGEYALLCFVPDEGDGQLHLAHGMIRQFRVD